MAESNQGFATTKRCERLQCFETFLDILTTLGQGSIKVIRSAVDLLHMKSIEEINIQIVTVDSDFAIEVDILRKNISLVGDYYHIIFIGTEGVVAYGTSDIIPSIQKLIQEKEFYKATEKMENFFNNLEERIIMLKNDVANMKKDCDVQLKGYIAKRNHEEVDTVKEHTQGEQLQFGK